MKRSVIVFFVLTSSFPCAAEDVSVSKAIDILETSLNKRERIDAVAVLRDAKEAAAPAASLLARIIAQDPCGDEAAYAAESLGYIGEASIPLIASLIQNGFDWSYLCASRASCLPHGADELILAELEPILKSNPYHGDRFNAILMLGSYPLKPESANKVCLLLMSKEYAASIPSAALFIAPKANDARILDAIEAHQLKSMKYLGARIREEWRRRPILQELTAFHVPQPLPKGEQIRFEEADVRLAALAKEARPEALDKLRDAGTTHEQYFWFAMVRELGTWPQPPRENTIEVLDSVKRKRGSTIDRLLIDYKTRLTRSLEKSK